MSAKCTQNGPKMDNFTSAKFAGPDKFFSLGRHKSDGISSYTCRILKIFGDSESWGHVDVSYAQKR